MAFQTKRFNFLHSEVKLKVIVKVTFTLEHATRAHSLFNLGARWEEGGQLHAPAALPPGKLPVTHCIGGWVGPRAGLDGCGKYRPTPTEI